MELLETIVIPPDEGRALVLRKGESIRIYSEWHVDFVLFDSKNLKEKFSQGRTKANQGKIFVSTNDKLYSKSNLVMCTITDDTYGKHDLQYGMCSTWVYQNVKYIADFAKQKRGSVPKHGCWESISVALEKWNIDPLDVPDPLNVFQTVNIDPIDGKMTPVPIKLGPQHYLQLGAEMDILVAASPCPSGGCSAKIEHYS